MLKKILAAGFFICVAVGMSEFVSAQEVFIRDEVLPVTNYIYHNSDGKNLGNIKYAEKFSEVKTDADNDGTELSDTAKKTSTEESFEDIVKENPDNPEE